MVPELVPGGLFIQYYQAPSTSNPIKHIQSICQTFTDKQAKNAIQSAY